MKFDKDTLIKQKFWVILGAGVLFTVVALVFLIAIVPRATAKKREDVDAKWKSVKDLKNPKTPTLIEIISKDAEVEKANETKVWEKAASSQQGLFFWPRQFEAQYEFENGLFATEIAVQGKDASLDGQPADEPKKGEEGKAATGKFHGKLVEATFEYVKVQGRDKAEKTFHRIPDAFLKVTAADDAGKAVRFTDLEKKKGAVVVVSYFRTRRFGDPLTSDEQNQYEATYDSQLLPVLREAGPVNELGEIVVQFPGWSWGKGKGLPPPESRFFRYVAKWDINKNGDISDEAWAAQEDLWIQRDVFRLVKKANDSVADFEPVKGAAGSFANPYWRIDVLAVQGDQVKFKLTNLLDRPQAVTVQFRVQFQPGGPFVALEPIKSHDPLAPRGANGGKDSLTAEQKINDKAGKAGKAVVGVRQVLTWETAAVRRIDVVSIGRAGGDEWSLSQRNAFRELQPLKKKPVEEKKDEPAGKDALMKEGAAPPGRGRPGPGMPGFGGAGAPGSESTPHGVILDRYFDVTPQARRVPVAVALIVDQAHATRVQTAFADSPLRFLINQVIMNRYPRSVRPESVTPADGLAGGEPSAGGMFGAFRPQGPSGMFPPGRGYPGMPPGMTSMMKPMMPGTGMGGGGTLQAMRPGTGMGGAGKLRPERPGSGMPYPGMMRPGSGMPYRGSGYPGMPGSSFGGAEQPADGGGEEQESNVELVIYGVVSLYEPYPPRQPLTAVEAPAVGAPDMAAPPAKDGKQP